MAEQQREILTSRVKLAIAVKSGKSMGMETYTETISTAGGPMGVHVVRPEGDGPFPVVVFFHHGPGLEQGSKDTMARRGSVLAGSSSCSLKSAVHFRPGFQLRFSRSTFATRRFGNTAGITWRLK